jgi:drug/metabolite transporter (DMT)-like permease
MVVVLIAAAGWALGSVLAHVLPLPSRALVSAAMEMLVAGSVIVLAGLVSGSYADVHWSDVSAESWWAFAWLVVAGSVLAFGAYAFALSELPLRVVATYAYVNPVVAVVLGAVLLGEQFSVREVIGTAIVVGSVAVTMQRGNPREQAPPDMPPGRAIRSRACRN